MRRTQSDRGNTVKPDVVLSANKSARFCESNEEPITSETEDGATVKTDGLKQ